MKLKDGSLTAAPCQSALRLLGASIAALAVASAAPAKDGGRIGSDGLTLTAANGALKLTVGGRLHVDVLAYESVIAFDDADVRRARLEVSGQIADIVRFRVDREFAGPDGWRNLWASIEPIEGLEIKAGNFTVPFAMEDLQSSNRIPLMERSLANALAPGFGLGVAAKVSQPSWTLAAGYFGEALGNEDDRANQRGKGFAGRATIAPISRRGKLVHLGAEVERRSFAGGDIVQFQTKPGSILAPRLLTTGRIADPADLINLGGEIALTQGPFLFQGHYVATKIRRTARPTLDFDGWYAQASLVLTGQRYEYSQTAGVVSGVDVRRGGGAVELAARYGELDLSDDSSVRGVGKAITFGANWYLNKNIRFMANYVRSEAEDVRGRADRKADLFAGRFQLSF